jgi:phage FluMu gp28-like protein
MNHLRQLGFYMIFILLIMTVPALAGCESDSTGDYYIIAEATGIRITAEALDLILDNDEEYTLTYSVRNS